MRLLIQTPFVDYNKYIPHLLEHCVWDDRNIDVFLKYNLEFEITTKSGYTELERDLLSIHEVIDKITTPIALETYQLEKTIIKQELKKTSFWQKIYQKLLQKLINPAIQTNNNLEVNYQQLLDYQQIYYQKDAMIFIDQEDNIDLNFWLWTNLKTQKLSLQNFTQPTAFSFDIQGELISGYCVEYKNPEDVLILDFLRDLLNTYQYAIISKEKQSYYSDFFDYSFTDSCFICSYDGKFPRFSLKKLEEFFPSFQNYAMHRIQAGKFNARKGEIALLLGKVYEIKEHLKLIQSLDFSFVKKLLLLARQ